MPVLDNQKNVVGNISHVDVKVSLILLSELYEPHTYSRSIAINEVELSSTAKLILYSFCDSDSPRAGSE